jgi:hypothetical protein
MLRYSAGLLLCAAVRFGEASWEYGFSEFDESFSFWKKGGSTTTSHQYLSTYSLV